MAKVLHWAKGLARWMGVDQAIAFTLAGHLWNIFSAPLLLVLMIRQLDAAERGLLFNFISICQLQVIFALGVGTVIQQLASRERAFLDPMPDGTLDGEVGAKQRLAKLFRGGLLWFVGVALVANLILLPSGWWFFQASPGTDSIDWQAAWVLTLAVAVSDSAVNSLMLFLSGCGHVTPVARVTAVKQAVMTTSLMIGLLAGWRLIAHPVSGLTGLLLCVGWIVWSRRRLLIDLWRSAASGSAFRWREDVWPLQWRVSLSWMSTMVVMHGLNPATLFWGGADEAGRVGLSMYILLTIQTMGWGWIATRIPTFGILAAQQRWADLMAVFWGVLTRSLVFILIVGGVMVALSSVMHFGGEHLIKGLQHFGSDVGSIGVNPQAAEGRLQPLLPPDSLVLLLFAVMALHAFLAISALLRAHGRDPILPVAMLMAATVLGILTAAGMYGTAKSMILAYSGTVTVLTLGPGVWVARQAIRVWHRERPATVVVDGTNQTSWEI
jgi:hypothetical protein